MAHEYYCESCEQECQVHVVDFGHGAFEYFGQRGVHVDKYAVSDCCDAALFNDQALTMKADLDPADYGDDPDRKGDEIAISEMEASQ